MVIIERAERANSTAEVNVLEVEWIILVEPTRGDEIFLRYYECGAGGLFNCSTGFMPPRAQQVPTKAFWQHTR
nr:hypothetical protein [Cryobacterium sp. M91]